MTRDTANTPTASQVVDSMERMAGSVRPDKRRSSARGLWCTGTFTPTGAAAKLTTAAHLQHRPVPVTVRFSNSEGNPHVPDTAPVTRGMATRFHLPDGTDTDLLGITVPLFVASTPREFLELTEALRPDPASGHPDPARVHAFVAANPHLAEPITQQPPVPASYGSTAYWAIHAFIWLNADGARQPVRYRWQPAAGRTNLTADEAAAQADDYLTTELNERLRREPVSFTLYAQLGEPGDPTDDPTVAWPAERSEIAVGRLELAATAPDEEHRAGQGFDPTRLTAGIELSDDPVLAFRSHAYAESYRRRTTVEMKKGE